MNACEILTKFEKDWSDAYNAFVKDLDGAIAKLKLKLEDPNYKSFISTLNNLDTQYVEAMKNYFGAASSKISGYGNIGMGWSNPTRPEFNSNNEFNS